MDFSDRFEVLFYNDAIYVRVKDAALDEEPDPVYTKLVDALIKIQWAPP
ncbi:MAG: hypothetical protein ACYSWU_00245 [Planctomycetota bacterium]|jgi:hypothetical protein